MLRVSLPTYVSDTVNLCFIIYVSVDKDSRGNEICNSCIHKSFYNSNFMTFITIKTIACKETSD